MIKYLFALVLLVILSFVGIMLGASNDQMVTFNYIIAQNELPLSLLVGIIFGLGLSLGWILSFFFYLKLKFKNGLLNRQLKHQSKQLQSLNTKA